MESDSCQCRVDISNCMPRRELELGEVWECPHDPVDGEYLCMFHLPIKKKRECGITPENVKERLIHKIHNGSEKERKFLSGDFSFIDIDYTRFRGTNTIEPIEFSGSHIEGLQIRYSEFHQPVLFNQCTINWINLSQCEFNYNLRFTDCEFANGFEFEYQSEVYMDHIDSGRITFAGAEIYGDIYLHHSDIEHITYTRADIHESIRFLAVDFGNFDRYPVDEEFHDTSIYFENCTIDTGRLGVPEDGSWNYVIYESTLGDISFEYFRDDDNLFNYVDIEDTSFDGFNMSDYRAHLDPHWKIHGSDQMKSRYESTYHRAKQGAKQQGDTTAISGFFINEMRCRRDRYNKTASNASSYISRMWWKYKEYSNTVYDVGAEYGENPKRILGMSILYILIFAMLFPLVGFKNNQSGLVYRYSLDGNIANIWDSIYFSVVTFTTLGHGDYQPIGFWSQLLTGIESFGGVVLTAFLVFVLGRKVSR